jgi:hypothetical protein
MVDTQDLKSCGHNGCAGSSPAPGTSKPSYLKDYKRVSYLWNTDTEDIESIDDASTHILTISFYII